MKLFEQLQITRGITAIIGSGGKTTMLQKLGQELSQTARVVLCTTTKIYPFSHIPTDDYDAAALEQAFAETNLLCAARPAPMGKLQAPTAAIAELAQAADYVLVEADGSRGLPLKAHEMHEPVITEGCSQVILVAGLTGLQKPIAEVCHRPARFAALCGRTEQEPVTPQDLAAVIEKEHLCDRVFLNQQDVSGQAEAVAGFLHYPVIAGSLQKGEYQCLR